MQGKKSSTILAIFRESLVQRDLEYRLSVNIDFSLRDSYLQAVEVQIRGVVNSSSCENCIKNVVSTSRGMSSQSDCVSVPVEIDVDVNDEELVVWCLALV